ncbi:hypothetical protein LMG3410_03036 [Achromobacter aegrifaciens]|nr:hypothetical protein LMG3410_03036 [Achromobacter aegrifaciens]
MRQRVVLLCAGDDLVILAARIYRGRPGQRARCIARRRRGRRHVVEEAVVFVEHQQQDGLAPDLRVGRQRIQHPGRVVGALRRAGRAGMLGAGLRGADPRDLRQRAVQHVLAQQVQAAGGERLFLQRGRRARRAMVGVAVGLEAGGRVQRIIVRHVLVDAPADAGGLQAFGIGRPGVGARRIAARELVVGIAQGRAVAAAQAVVGAGPDEQPVGVGAAGERAVIGVADREGARHGVLEGHVLVREVRHRMVLLGGRPVAHAARVPGVLRVGPGVRRAGHAHGFEGLARIQMEGQDRARRAFIGFVVVLRPDGAMARVGAIRHGYGKAVAKPAYAGQRAEVMIERAVLLHEDHDVFHVADRARAPRRGDRERAADGGGQQGQGAAGAGQRRAAAEKITSGLHEAFLRTTLPAQGRAAGRGLKRRRSYFAPVLSA